MTDSVQSECTGKQSGHHRTSISRYSLKNFLIFSFCNAMACTSLPSLPPPSSEIDFIFHAIYQLIAKAEDMTNMLNRIILLQGTAQVQWILTTRIKTTIPPPSG